MRFACLLLLTALTASAQVRLPDYTRTVLSNGVVTYVLVRQDVPMVTLRAIVRGGAETDPLAKAGLASVTADLLRGGTSDRTADQFSEQLDFIGATFSTSVDEQSTTITSEFLSKDTDQGLALFADVILDPTFPEAEVQKVLARRIDSVKAVKDSPRAAIGRYFRSFFFPDGHPYSRQTSGDEVTLDRIRRDDIVACHQRLYAGRNLTVLAVGDFDAAAMATKLNSAFGELGAGERYAWAPRVPSLAREGARLLLVDKPGATQTYFRIAQPGIDRKHPDRDALRLVNTLFGGRFTSMLNDELRVNAGLTYGAFSRLDRDRLRGAITIDTFTGTETTAEAIDLALEVLERFREKGIDEEQLTSAKAYIEGLFPTSTIETAGQLAAVLGDLELYELDRSEIDGFFQRIDAITVEQANAAIRKHYAHDALQFILVGDAGKIRETVAKYAPQLVEVSITDPGFAPRKRAD